VRALLQRWLPRPRVAAAIVVLGVLLQSPSVTTGWVADDLVQQLVVRGDRSVDGLPTSRLALFTFASGDPARNHRLMDAGFFPWTADPELKLSFFRPLTSLTHLADELAAPESAVMAHLHNLLWFALSLVAVALFYRRFLGAGFAAGLALLLYTVDDARGPTVGWVANRNALVALALSLPALVFHDRWRRDGWRPGAYLAPLALVLGLFAGESALAVCGYLAAYALHLERGSAADRLRTLLPAALSVIGWMILYRLLGHGTAHSGVYFDPAHETAAFLHALPTRLPMLLLGQLALPPSDFSGMWQYVSPRLPALMVGFACAVLALGAWFVLPLLRRSATARFFTTGLLFAVLPVCATFPADRLLSFVGVGAFGLIALALEAPPRGRAGKLIAGALVLLHLIVAVPLAALRSRSMETVDKALARTDRSLPASADLAGRTMVIVNPPAEPLVAYFLVSRSARHQPRPARVRWLAATFSSVEVERIDARTLRVRPECGLLEDEVDRLLRDPARPFPVGSRVALTGMTAEVTALTADQRPAEARFTFDVPLEDPSLVWSAWTGGGFARWTPPPVGARVTLPASSFASAFLGAP
jgi:hypothetical protein